MESELKNSIDQSTNGLDRRDEAWNAVNWFKDRLDQLSAENKKPLKTFPNNMNQTFTTSRINLRSTGRMFMFTYDAKHKDKLPYWDALPLIILVGVDSDGFTGLNLHYLPPLARKAVIRSMQDNLDFSPIVSDFLSRNEKKKITISYSILQKTLKYPIIKPCFKKYLFSHVRSNFLYVDPVEWEKAIMLPTERFQKAPKARVHRESIAMSGAIKAERPLTNLIPSFLKDLKNTTFFRKD